MSNGTTYDAFCAGVTACLRSWSALRTAVESGWGGHDSLRKAEDLRAYVLQHFHGRSFPPALDVDELEDNLTIYMEEEFSVVLEDGSERQVADVIWRMYEACSKGDASLAQQVVAAAERAVHESVSYPVHIQSMEHDDDDDDDEEEEEEDDDDDDAMEGTDDPGTAVSGSSSIVSTPRPAVPISRDFASQPLFGQSKRVKPSIERPARQLGQAPEETPISIEVDEDGFATLPRKGRRKPR